MNKDLIRHKRTFFQLEIIAFPKGFEFLITCLPHPSHILIMIRFSTHVEQRMHDRRISKEEINETLLRPAETRQLRYGRQGVFKRLTGDSFLIVVFEKSNEDLIVVTALKVDERRVKRYGFTRI